VSVSLPNIDLASGSFFGHHRHSSFITLAMGLWRKLSFAHSIPGVARVVSKRLVESRGEESDSHILKLVLLESGELRGNGSEVHVDDQTWKRTQIGGQIDVRYLEGRYDEVRPVSGVLGKIGTFFLLLFLLLWGLGWAVTGVCQMLHILPGFGSSSGGD
jgi:hypothetical protein